jgi:hypothetical protein
VRTVFNLHRLEERKKEEEGKGGGKEAGRGRRGRRREGRKILRGDNLSSLRVSSLLTKGREL